ncbi:MAG: hypothetical protein ACKO14_11580 [Armatimonadota bacterium]
MRGIPDLGDACPLRWRISRGASHRIQVVAVSKKKGRSDTGIRLRSVLGQGGGPTNGGSY